MAFTQEQADDAVKTLLSLGYRETKTKKALYKFYPDGRIKFIVFFPYKNLQRPYAKEINKDGFLNLKQLESISEKFYDDAQKLREQ